MTETLPLRNRPALDADAQQEWPALGSGLGDALADAAEQVLGSVPRWHWTRRARSLVDEASVQAWFDVAYESLGIQCVQHDLPLAEERSALPVGTYLLFSNGRWRTLTHLPNKTWLLDGEPCDAAMLTGATMYRVAPAHSYDRLGWKQIKEASIADGSTLNKILWSTLLINIFVLVIPLYMNAIFDRVLPAQATMSLWVLSLGVALCLGLELLLRNDRSHALGQLADQFQYGIEPQLISRISHAPMSAELRWGAAGVEALAAWSRLRSLYWGIVASSLADSVFTVLYLAIIAWIGGLVVLVPLAAMMVAFWLIWRFDRGIKAMGNDDAAPFNVSAKSFGIHQAINAEKTMVEGFLASSETMRLREQRRYMLQSRCTAQFAALSNMQTVLIVVASFYLVDAHLMQPAGIFATILLAARVLQPLGSLMNVLPSLRQMRACVKKVNEVLEKVNDEPVASIKTDTLQDGWNLQNVSFGYRTDNDVFKDISLRIRPKECLALVGPSGAGKTAMLQLLLGQLSPTKGSVMWGGAALAGQHAYSLREHIHYAWQSPEVIGSNAMEYLQCERATSKDELLQALNRARLGPTIARWPQGLLTPFSLLPALTQKTHEQLALARIILSRRELFVLDAPAESLDQHSEKALIETLQEKRERGATIIIATDRANLLTLVDRVIHIDGGQIQFDGSVQGFREKRL